MLEFLASWLRLVPRSELEVQQSQAAATIRDLIADRDVSQATITRLRDQVDGLAQFRALLTRPPDTLEELRWQVLVGYGFTPQAAAICYSVDLGPVPDSDAGTVDGLAGPTFVRLKLTVPRDRALHEFLHVCWWRLDFESQKDVIWAAMLRLLNGDGTPDVVLLARRAFTDVQENLPIHQEWVRLGTLLAGNTGRLPGYLWPYFEGVFTGAPLA